MASVNPLSIFAPGLNQTQGLWMAVGSIASNAYGEARTTLDLDLVILLGPSHVARFGAAFPEEDFYCPPAEVIAEESNRTERGHFNLLHHESGYKADVYLATRDGFQVWAMRNRRRLAVGDEPVWIAPPEYVIVHKLEFFREGGSEKHLRDIRGMLAVTEVDRALIAGEVERRGLVDQWRQCQAAS